MKFLDPKEAKKFKKQKWEVFFGTSSMNYTSTALRSTEARKQKTSTQYVKTKQQIVTTS